MEGVQAASAASVAAGAIKDTTGAQLITKTLDRMNTFQTVAGPKIDAGYQMRKDVLNAAGIGKTLDAVV